MMEERRKYLCDLRTYIQNTDSEITKITQTFQWNQKQVAEKPQLVRCSYDLNHKIPEGVKEAHEHKCYLTRYGYSKDDQFLPEPVDSNGDTVVKLCKQDIKNIILAVSEKDATFKKVALERDVRNILVPLPEGKGCQGPEPLTVDRLQQAYTADERRTIHNAVVRAAPFCHDLAELALGSGVDNIKKAKSRLEVLAELRDMRRRRVRYRVSSKTSNYSHVLKDVIKTQMDLYAEAHGVFIKTEYGVKTYVSINNKESLSVVPKTSENFFIKREKVTPARDLQQDALRGSSHGHHDRERQGGQQDQDRHHRDTRQYARSRYESNRHQYGDRSRSRDRDRYAYKTHRRESGDKSNSDYTRTKIKEEIKSDKPRSYQSENTDTSRYYDKSSSQRYEDRRRSDDRHRYENRKESHNNEDSRNEDRHSREDRKRRENRVTRHKTEEHEHSSMSEYNYRHSCVEGQEKRDRNKDSLTHEDRRKHVSKHSHLDRREDTHRHQHDLKHKHKDRHADNARHRNEDRHGIDDRHRRNNDSHRPDDRRTDADRHEIRDGRKGRDRHDLYRTHNTHNKKQNINIKRERDYDYDSRSDYSRNDDEYSQSDSEYSRSDKYDISRVKKEKDEMQDVKDEVKEELVY